MGVSYGEKSDHVYRGNILYPRQVSVAPTITLPANRAMPTAKDGLYTLTLTNPDGNWQCNSKEVLHWMMLVYLIIIITNRARAYNYCGQDSFNVNTILNFARS